MHWAPEQKWNCQDSCLFVAFLGKAQLSSHVAQPSHILQVFCSMKTCPIVQSPVPLQQAVLSPMWDFAGPQARVRPVYVYAWKFEFTFSGLQSHHCEGSEKNCRQSFSIRPTATARTFPPEEVASALWLQVNICNKRHDSKVSRRHSAIYLRIDDACKLRIG